MSTHKNILITGGNSGIGLETAKLFKTQGYDVTILGRNKNSVMAVAKDYGFKYVVADLVNVANLENIAKEFPNGLDVLVNNAGDAGIIPLADMTIDNMVPVFTVNVYAIFYLIRLLSNALEERAGVVINVSSIIVNNGKPGMSIYAATKGAVDAMTRSLALEMAEKNIRVNAVSPGAIDTPVLSKLGIPEEHLKGLKEQQANAIPVKRLGYPEEVAEVIFAQAQAGYVNGSIWTVDGGVDAS